MNLIIALILMVEDMVTRAIMHDTILYSRALSFQIIVIAVFIGILMIKTRKISVNPDYKQSCLFRLMEMMTGIFYISTLTHSQFYYFILLMPIAYTSLSKGFRQSIPYIAFSWIFQIILQLFVKFVLLNNVDFIEWSELGLVVTVVSMQYSIFIFFSFRFFIVRFNFV